MEFLRQMSREFGKSVAQFVFNKNVVKNRVYVQLAWNVPIALIMYKNSFYTDPLILLRFKNIAEATFEVMERDIETEEEYEIFVEMMLDKFPR